MSTTPGFSIPDKARRNSSHRRTDSGELDVFEAERYFSSATTESLPQKIGNMSTREEYYGNSRQLGSWRTSLDMSMIMRHHTLSKPQHIILETIKPNNNEKKKHKQPSSPGGKLASFFNSLINQTVSKKNKKSTKSTSQSVKDVIVEEDSPGGWRRRRRNSITTFSSTTTTRNTKTTTLSEIDSIPVKPCSSLVSGFRTPPPYMINNTSIKPYKEFKNAFSNSKAGHLDEKLKIGNGLSSKDSGCYAEKKNNWVARNEEEEQESKDFKRFMEEDGAESDSSSDLFELQLNCDPHRRRRHHHHQSGYCASDLPVYGSTHMDTINVSTGTPITNGPFRN